MLPPLTAGSSNPKPIGILDFRPPPSPAEVHKRIEDASKGAPGQPIPQDTTLIGADTRQLVVNPLEYPFSAICALRIQGSRSTSILAGTGVLIAPRLVLTAGHNLFNNTTGGNAVEVRVYAGLNGNYTTVRSVLGVRFLSVVEWVNGGNPSFDYGAIVLPTDLGTQLGFFSVQGLANQELASLMVNNAGYPVDCPGAVSASCPLPGTRMFLDTGQIIQATDFTFTHTLDTAGGSSGSPLFLVQNVEPLYRVIGVHTYGISTGMGNIATRINLMAYETIVDWINRTNGGQL
jgi:V8-like Glu-specific endopeptidase